MSGETAQAIISGISLVLGLAINVLWLAFMLKVFNWFAYERIGRRPAASNLKYFFRQMLCAHKKGYSRVQSELGNYFTACNHCGKDMNAGRRSEDQV